MRKTNYRPAAPKIAESAAIWIENTFPNLNAGLTWLADTAQVHHEAALDEIKGVFSSEDLTAILEALKDSGGMVYGPPAMSGQLLSMLIPEKSEIGRELAILTRFQKAALETWAVQFWVKEDPATIEIYKSRLL